MANSFREDLLRNEVRLPAREFLFSLEQICQMLDCSQEFLEKEILYFAGRSVGARRNRLYAVNIASAESKPVWRVSETEFKVWMRTKRIKFTEPVNVRLRKR